MHDVVRLGDDHQRDRVRRYERILTGQERRIFKRLLDDHTIMRSLQQAARRVEQGDAICQIQVCEPGDDAIGFALASAAWLCVEGREVTALTAAEYLTERERTEAKRRYDPIIARLRQQADYFRKGKFPVPFERPQDCARELERAAAHFEREQRGLIRKPIFGVVTRNAPARRDRTRLDE
jgi:hypothetical protein